MLDWLEGVVGPQYAPALMWTVAALFLFLLLLIVIRVVRGFTFGTFVSGGRNRKTRLAVMDATAVDSHRRLVLVRRDDVEHLILIGGPTDVVVEQNIRVMASSRMPAMEQHPEPQAMAQPAEPPRQPQPERVAPPPPAATVAPALPPLRTAQPQPQPMAQQTYRPQPSVQPSRQAPAPVAAPQPRPAPMVSQTAAPAPQQPRVTPPMQPVTSAPSYRQPVAAPAPLTSRATPVAPQEQQHDLDDALLRELEISLDRDHAAPQGSGRAPDDRSADKAVSQLMTDLTAKR